MKKEKEDEMVKVADLKTGTGIVAGTFPHTHEDGHKHVWRFPEDAEPEKFCEDVYCELCGEINYFPEYTIDENGRVIPVDYEE
jgi:hypothetical protein